MKQIRGIPFRIQLGDTGSAQTEVGLFKVTGIRINSRTGSWRINMLRLSFSPQCRKGRASLLN
jgi:hypothetical protein